MKELGNEATKKTISLLVPCYNEEAVLEKLYNRTVSVIANLPQYSFEFVFVNDGSKDHTLDILKKLRYNDSRVSYVNLSRNFGKEIAMIAGIDYLNGDAVIIMDADLQDPPEMIPEMISWWEKGYDDVSAKRRSRKGESFFKKWSSHTYYKVLQKVSSIPIQPDVGDFRLLDKQCINALRTMRESQRYTKGMFSWIGFNKKEILFDRDARAAGKTKWNYRKLTNLAIEGITSFTTIPLRIASIVGCMLLVIGLADMVYVIISNLIQKNEILNIPFVISLILIMGGSQLLSVGIMGEYIGNVFKETKKRPLYLVKDYNGNLVIKQKGYEKM